jgi:hypothetical protein
VRNKFKGELDMSNLNWLYKKADDYEDYDYNWQILTPVPTFKIVGDLLVNGKTVELSHYEVTTDDHALTDSPYQIEKNLDRIIKSFLDNYTRFAKKIWDRGDPSRIFAKIKLLCYDKEGKLISSKNPNNYWIPEPDVLLVGNWEFGGINGDGYGVWHRVDEHFRSFPIPQENL